MLFFHHILFILSAKYEYKKFFDKSALVASKLGHSRSASLAQVPPSATLPQSVSLPRSSAHTTKPHAAASTASTSSYAAQPSKHPQMLPTTQPPQSSRGAWDDIKPHVTATTAPTSSYTVPRPNPPQMLPTTQPSGGAWDDIKPHVTASTASTSSYTASRAKPAQMLPTTQQLQHSGGVWDDLSSLKGNNSQNSSLPLQYQQPTYSQGSHSMQLPAVNDTTGANNYIVGVTASGMGLNPYQSNQDRQNPFAQPLSRPPFAPSSITSSFSTAPTMPVSSQPFGQQPFDASQSSTVTPPYYNPQSMAQPSMQIQNPSGQSFISESQSHLYPSTTQPTSQSQFTPQSHNVPQQQYISHSPQLMQSSSNPQIMYQNPEPAQSQMGGHNVSGQSQFLGMTTMQMQQQQQQMQMQQQQQHQQKMQQQKIQQQMQQQQMLQQQMQQQQIQPHQPQLGQNYPSMQPQMMSHQFNSTNSAYSQTPAYSQGSFPAQTGHYYPNTM